MYSLHPLSYEDLEWFVAVRNSSREFLHDQRAFSLKDAQTWWHLDRKTRYEVILFREVPVGYFRLGEVEEHQDFRLLWIGCDIAPSFRRQGHARNAYSIFMPHFLEEVSAQGFILRVIPQNLPAMALYRRLGFQTSAIRTVEDRADKSLKVVDIEMIHSHHVPLHDTVDLLLVSRSSSCSTS